MLSAPCSYCEERGRTPRGAGTGGDSASTNNAQINGYRLRYRLNVSAPRGASESEESASADLNGSGANSPRRFTLARPLSLHFHRAGSRSLLRPCTRVHHGDSLGTLGAAWVVLTRRTFTSRSFHRPSGAWSVVAGSGTPMGGGPWRGVVSPRTGVRPSGCPPSRSRASPRVPAPRKGSDPWQGERPSRSALPPPRRGQVRSKPSYGFPLLKTFAERF